MPHGVHIAYQAEPLGTGDAVKAAVQKLDHFDGTVLVTYGADPLIGIETLEKMVMARAIEDPPDVVVFGFKTQTPRVTAGQRNAEAGSKRSSRRLRQKALSNR